MDETLFKVGSVCYVVCKAVTKFCWHRELQQRGLQRVVLCCAVAMEMPELMMAVACHRVCLTVHVNVPE